QPYRSNTCPTAAPTTLRATGPDINRFECNGGFNVKQFMTALLICTLATPLQAERWAQDKTSHFTAGALIAFGVQPEPGPQQNLWKTCSYTFGLGLLKEIWDIDHGTSEWGDVLATGLPCLMFRIEFQGGRRVRR
ncbi:hypothetical protein, partial [Candidatus Halocynthiibacter alkanivorans]|uniref:hypothetical protein n=1 Tax=Candidatus Halocynthiibacter alkanivorans TaxID=2267619 RepID=UPI001F18D4E7